ncbi:MAG: hypothetical protein LBI20_02280 [Holosporales bacterium]|jgi:hypothetical protein|nr:hypothetical protein [Holosporales bacterium]
MIKIFNKLRSAAILFLSLEISPINSMQTTGIAPTPLKLAGSIEQRDVVEALIEILERHGAKAHFIAPIPWIDMHEEETRHIADRGLEPGAYEEAFTEIYEEVYQGFLREGFDAVPTAARMAEEILEVLGRDPIQTLIGYVSIRDGLRAGVLTAHQWAIVQVLSMAYS